MRSTQIIKICSSSLCTCLHHMVILRTRNKITDFLMILAWASPFNKDSCRRTCPRVVVSTAAFHARIRGSVPGLGVFNETKMFLPHPGVKISIVGSVKIRARISNPVSEGQCHLTIPRRFSWPSLAYMCTKVA